MKKIIPILLSLWLVPLHFASAAVTQCGDFTLVPNDDGWMRINGAKPESQKITFLRQKEDYRNIKIEWRMATSQPGLWVGMEYIKRDGKAFLNTQMLRASMDAPREFATYDCVKVK
ncbi:hypothetical protein [Serratia fonticola]